MKKLFTFLLFLLPLLTLGQSSDATLSTQNTTEIKQKVYASSRAYDMFQAIIDSKVSIIAPRLKTSSVLGYVWTATDTQGHGDWVAATTGGGVQWSDGSSTAISGGTLQSSVMGNEKIPVSGSGHPVINANRLHAYHKARFDSLYTHAKVFNITDYGASVNGKVAYGAIASSSHTLTITSSQFTSGMVGQTIEIPGAGVAGSELITTIATFISVTQITTTAAASTTITHEKIWWGSDDTAGWLAAIAAWDASGGAGKVIQPIGISIINGALITSGTNPNAQIPIPASVTTDTTYFPKTLFIEGMGYSQAWYNDIPPYGSVIKSMKRTGTGTNPSIIGGIGTATNNPIGYWNTTNVHLNNIGIIMATNGGHSTSNMIGYNGLNIITTGAENFGVITDCYAFSTTQPNPLGTGFTGIIIGKKDNVNGSVLTNVASGGGFEYAIVVGGEHTELQEVAASGAYYGFTFLNTNFSVTGSIDVSFCNNMLYFPNVSTFVADPGSTFVDLNVGFETSGVQTGASWYNFQYFINDVGNNARGVIKAIGQNGTTNSFGNLGARYVNVQSLQESYSDNKFYPQDGITAYYDFSEVSGVRADGTGYGNSLTPTGTVTRVAGNLASAYGVNLPYGVNYLEGGSSNNQSTSTRGFTFATWFKTSYAETNTTIAGKWATGQKEWVFYYSGSELRFGISNDGTTLYADAGTGGGTFTADDLWHYITCQWNGTSIIITVDGEIKATQAASSMFQTGTANFSIGKDLLATSSHFVASFQFPAIYRRSLSLSEIRYLMNAGVGRIRPDYQQRTDLTPDLNIGNKVANVLAGSATLNFADTAAGASTDLTITVTGATDGDPVLVGPVNASTNANGVFTAWVSASNTVTVRFTNTNLVTSINPASGIFKVTVIKQ